ncbi:MAG: phospho-N-acetylmuramoyl-pentapeptide-transferase [Candidatus Omnitrophica bacterium]|nr:phospho-N-acetylmuramoyl-pentapeptide-transferase [Candidatus Omnitrophota bacterium]MDE2009817.1 phospho-N-acetylmuramoyl-pentapeptide-transferase [Candidatus Omnitrophota bacterium]MDE2214946.1 phospho-N-acetylmuramoyl-pentapeptide-transferase [Candidatus Omnitrophota bacterium]MDE2231516.1 phospho-N-acetylmuramoyl-pentapeptide-transferase [Candidatus Omnitrophota bacterium]
MFYFLSQYFTDSRHFNIFHYITFRAGMAGVTAFLLCMILGPVFIRLTKRRRVRESARRHDAPALDPFQAKKEGTPTMGGVFIIGSILASIALWGNWTNSFMVMTTWVCVSFAFLGGWDDYVKLKGIGPHRGVSARVKSFWQVVIAFIVGVFVYLYPDITTNLDVPFFKDLVINLGPFFVFWVVLVVVGSCNAVNLTDGLDGLAIGCTLMVAFTLAILSYVTGNTEMSNYLYVPYVPGAGELTVFCTAIVGASLGFLWFNCYPATVFMGDVGSLALGGSLGMIAVLIKKEVWLVVLGGVFVIEAGSVILQVFSFKLTGRRVFKMSPFHHHLQLSGWNENKIIVRFWIAAIIMAMLTITTLKIR